MPSINQSNKLQEDWEHCVGIKMAMGHKELQYSLQGVMVVP